jgi:hypothetical protein
MEEEKKTKKKKKKKKKKKNTCGMNLYLALERQGRGFLKTTIRFWLHKRRVISLASQM